MKHIYDIYIYKYVCACVSVRVRVCVVFLGCNFAVKENWVMFVKWQRDHLTARIGSLNKCNGVKWERGGGSIF